MNCFDHNEITAIGICKNCNKGLCKNCLTEVPNGIACTNGCIEQATELNTLVMKTKSAQYTAVKSQYRVMFLYFGIGLVFILNAILSERFSIPMVLFGSFFLLAGFLSLKAVGTKDQTK